MPPQAEGAADLVRSMRDGDGSSARTAGGRHSCRRRRDPGPPIPPSTICSCITGPE
jgi:hypothetical protein